MERRAVHTLSLRGSPRVPGPGKILCVGRNYATHVKEMKADLPSAPVLFLKTATAVVDSGGVVEVPAISSEVHHEVEMTVLIGTSGRRISPGQALEHVAGYGVGLDMTLRDLQAEAKKQGLPWTLAKAFDSSAPLSEFVPAGGIPDPGHLGVRLLVNGELRQAGWTRDFIFSLGELISYASKFFTLEAGDVIFTGTPEGVGPVRPGDALRAELVDAGGAVLTSVAVTVLNAPAP